MDIYRTEKGVYCPHCGTITDSVELLECPVCGRVFPPKTDREPELVAFEHGGKKGVVGLNDHRVYVLPEYDGVFVRSFCDIIVEKDGKYAVVGSDGKVECLYDDYSPRTTVAGQYAVRVADKVGCVDREGHEVVPIKFDYIRENEAGLDGKTVIIDVNGNVLGSATSSEYIYCERLDDANHMVKSKKYGTYYVIDSFGEEAPEFFFSYYGYDSYEITDGVLKVSGRAQIGPGCFEGNSSVLVYCQNGFWGTGLGQFHEGLAQYRQWENGDLDPDEWGDREYEGYVNTNWEKQIPAIYDQTSPFLNGCARVRMDDDMFFINGKGERVPDSMIPDESLYPFISPATEMMHGPGDFESENSDGDECQYKGNLDDTLDKATFNYALDAVNIIDDRYVYLDMYGREVDVIDVVPICELSDNYIGRILAGNVNKLWIEDYEDEDNGEVVPYERTIPLIVSGEMLESYTLEKLRICLEAGEILDDNVVLVKALGER